MVGLNICDWTSCSSPLVLHVPSPFGQCALARRGDLGALPPRRGVWGAFAPHKPANSIPRQTQNINLCQVNFVAGCRSNTRAHQTRNKSHRAPIAILIQLQMRRQLYNKTNHLTHSETKAIVTTLPRVFQGAIKGLVNMIVLQGSLARSEKNTE